MRRQIRLKKTRRKNVTIPVSKPASRLIIGILLALSPFALAIRGLRGESEKIDLRRLPQEDSPVVATLEGDASAALLRVAGDWAEVRMGQVRGWAHLDQIWRRWEKLERETPPFRLQTEFQSQLRPPAPDSSGFEGLLDFALSSLRDRQLQRADPLGRHRTQGFFGRWGPFFYRRTSLYSWRGLQMARFWDERIGINLVKGKMHGNALPDACWSEAALESALAQRSLFNRSFLGRRKSLFLELRYSF